MCIFMNIVYVYCCLKHLLKTWQAFSTHISSALCNALLLFVCLIFVVAAFFSLDSMLFILCFVQNNFKWIGFFGTFRFVRSDYDFLFVFLFFVSISVKIIIILNKMFNHFQIEQKPSFSYVNLYESKTDIFLTVTHIFTLNVIDMAKL